MDGHSPYFPGGGGSVFLAGGSSTAASSSSSAAHTPQPPQQQRSPSPSTSFYLAQSVVQPGTPPVLMQPQPASQQQQRVPSPQQHLQYHHHQQLPPGAVPIPNPYAYPQGYRPSPSPNSSFTGQLPGSSGVYHQHQPSPPTQFTTHQIAGAYAGMPQLQQQGAVGNMQRQLSAGGSPFLPQQYGQPQPQQQQHRSPPPPQQQQPSRSPPQQHPHQMSMPMLTMQGASMAAHPAGGYGGMLPHYSQGPPPPMVQVKQVPRSIPAPLPSALSMPPGMPMPGVSVNRIKAPALPQNGGVGAAGTASGASSSSSSLLGKRKRELEAAGGGKTLKRRPRADSDSDDDGAGGYGSDDSGGEGYMGAKELKKLQRLEEVALKFFQNAEAKEISELAGCNPTQAGLLVKLRPFVTLDEVRAKIKKQKGCPNSLVDNYLEVQEGMYEVDKILTDCEAIGSELSKVMKIWATHGGAAGSGTGTSTPATNTSATSSRAGTPDVGLHLVNLPAVGESSELLLASTEPEVRKAFTGFLRTQPSDIPEQIVLKDYQMLGLNWLNLLYRRKTSAILADEMGLGKTAQVIALLVHLKSLNERAPHLVVVPSSTLENWLREFANFGPTLNVQEYYGSQAERAELRHEIRHNKDLDVVVTTYNIATGSQDDHKFLRKKMKFNIIVFDEGHQLKNSQSKKHQELMRIPAKWRLLLTGTPLQNNLQELVSLLSFILPEQFQDADESLRAIFKVSSDAQASMLSRERVSRAKKMMNPFVLRRKKAQVLKDLPNKFERIEWCEMTSLQREVYTEALGRSRRALLELNEEALEELAAKDAEAAGEEGGAALSVEKKGPAAKKPKATTKVGNSSDSTSSSNVLMELRKASNHPMLFRRLFKDSQLPGMARDCLKEDDFLDRNKDYIIEDLGVMTDFEIHRFCGQYKHLKKYQLKDEPWMSAGKVGVLQKLLPQLKADGHRVLLFSQFTMILDILEVVLTTLGIKYLKLTGQTAVTDRQGLVDEFTDDPDITVFLLSTRAGGLGLNLVAADTVIIHDHDFNPHADKQAEDRAYRIGQVRDVTVIKLITRDSVEEDMLALAQTKLRLDDTVSGATDGPDGEPLDEDEDEAQNSKVEKKMRTSLLTNLKKRFEGEMLAAGSGTSPIKEEPIPLPAVDKAAPATEEKQEVKPEVPAVTVKGEPAVKVDEDKPAAVEASAKKDDDVSMTGTEPEPAQTSSPVVVRATRRKGSAVVPDSSPAVTADEPGTAAKGKSKASPTRSSPVRASSRRKPAVADSSPANGDMEED